MNYIRYVINRPVPCVCFSIKQNVRTHSFAEDAKNSPAMAKEALNIIGSGRNPRKHLQTSKFLESSWLSWIGLKLQRRSQHPSRWRFSPLNWYLVCWGKDASLSLHCQLAFLLHRGRSSRWLSQNQENGWRNQLGQDDEVRSPPWLVRRIGSSIDWCKSHAEDRYRRL